MFVINKKIRIFVLLTHNISIMENRYNYNWRPNDYSSKTLLRYRLEGEHWYKSIKSASTESSTSLSETLGFIGVLISIVVTLLIIIFDGLISLIKWATPKKEFKPRTPEQIFYDGEMPYNLTYDEMRRLYDNKKE